MLFYSKITESEGIDKSEGLDVVRDVVFFLINSATFVTSTFSKTETLTIGLMFFPRKDSEVCLHNQFKIQSKLTLLIRCKFMCCSQHFTTYLLSLQNILFFE